MPYPSHKPPAEGEREARALLAQLSTADKLDLRRQLGGGGVREPAAPSMLGRAQETYGEDPLQVRVMGAAMTRGIQHHAIACDKHFPLNSIDSSRFLVGMFRPARRCCRSSTCPSSGPAWRPGPTR